MIRIAFGVEPLDLSVVIPTKNEAGNIETAVRGAVRVLDRMGIDYEVLVVDAGSADGTADLAAKAGARVVIQERPGYGGAILDGLAASTAEFVLTFDADLSHPPEFIPRLWREREGADLVIASRYVPGGFAEMPASRYWLSRVLNWFFTLTLAVPVRDQSSGFRLYRREAVPAAEITGSDFSLLQDLLIRLVTDGRTIREVPFYYRPRTAGSSNARVLAFGISYLRTLARHFRRRHGPNAADHEYRAAFNWNPLRSALTRKRYALVRAAVEGSDAVLIAGSGSSVFAAMYPGVTAVDLNAAKVRFLQSRGAKAVCADARAMPFSDASFDAAVATWMLTLPTSSGALAECARVLKPGGAMVIHVPAADGWLFELLGLLRPVTPLRITAPEPIAAKNRDEWVAEMERHGIEVMSITRVLAMEYVIVGRKKSPTAD